MTYEKLIKDSTNKSRITWNIINSDLGKRAHQPSKDNIQTLSTEGKKITNLNIIVEVFNSHFIRVADSILKKSKDNPINSNNAVPSDYVGNHITYMAKSFDSSFPEIQIWKTTNMEIERVIQSLKVSQTHGYDEISNNILKACKTYISSPLSCLCNRVLFEGVFPDRLKYAKIIPVYKKGDKNNLSNYRPISILTSFNKILEKVIYRRLLKHLNIILSKHQFGFRANMGTDIAIFSLISGICDQSCVLNAVYITASTLQSFKASGMLPDIKEGPKVS
jgi:hypothetical protein